MGCSCDTARNGDGSVEEDPGLKHMEEEFDKYYDHALGGDLLTILFLFLL